MKDTQLILAGDGRCDSPGKCAKFCTYSFIEQENKLIVHTEVIDKREVKLKSPNMENERMVRLLDFLLQHVTVGEVINISTQNFR